MTARSWFRTPFTHYARRLPRPTGGDTMHDNDSGNDGPSLIEQAAALAALAAPEPQRGEPLDYTPEPWPAPEPLVAGAGMVVIHFPDSSGRVMVVFHPDRYASTSTAGALRALDNASRVHACVNACEGIADPATLRAERDALLAALRAAAAAMRCGDMPGHAASADAAIARATGGAA
jgi:hypothetical protein